MAQRVRRDLYIDMDGVLISLSHDRYEDGKYPMLVPDAMKFLEWAVKHFHCYYLTCWEEPDFDQYDHLKCLPRFPIREWKRGGRFPIKMSCGANKINGIDIKRPFYWLEDGCTSSERELLTQLGLIDNYVYIDPEDDYALTKWMEKMKKEGLE